MQRVDSILIEHEYYGVVQPARSVELGFPQAGLMTALPASTGTAVNAGELLAQLQSQALQRTRQALQDGLSESRAALQRVGEGESEMERIETRRQIDELWQQLNTARDAATFSDEAADERTARRLDDLEDRIRDLDAQSRALLNASRDQKRNESLANIRALEKQLRETENQLRMTRLEAPFSGQVTAVYVHPGNTVRAGQPVLQLQDRSSLQVSARLPHTVAEKLNAGQTIAIRVADENLEGTVRTIEPARQQTPGLRTVSVDLPSEATSDELLPGQAVRLVIQQEQESSGFWIPKSAATQEIESAWAVHAVVNREAETVVERRYVDIVHIAPDRLLIDGPLETGTLIVASGLLHTVPGQTVEVEAELDSDEVSGKDLVE